MEPQQRAVWRELQYFACYNPFRVTPSQDTGSYRINDYREVHPTSGVRIPYARPTSVSVCH